MGANFGTEEGTFGPLLRAKFHPHRCNVSPLRGENAQNRLLSKLNNRNFALRPMLPVNEANGPESKTTCVFRTIRQVAAPVVNAVVSDCILSIV